MARALARNAALVVVVAAAVVVTAVPPASPASAATVTIGTIQGQLANHVGQNNGTSGNCIRYAPPGTSTSSAFVSSPNEAITAHGYQGSCPAALSTSTQSAVGFRPSPVTTVEDGTQFLIGRMIHYNNPIQANDRYFTGILNTALTGFTAPNTLSFNWRLDETPNSPGNVNDEISFTNQVSTVALTQGGLTFRLVILGFVPTATATACPAAPTGPPVNDFSTVEGAQTHACLYASVVQVRSITIIKTVAGSPPVTPTFNYTSTSALAGSPWSNGTFGLASGGQETRPVTSGNTVTITETDPGDDRWTLTGLTCTQTGLNGLPQPVPGATLNLAARQVVLASIPPPPLASAPGITCTYTNTYTPRATLTLVKQVNSGTAAPSLWTLTATGSAAPPPSGTVISGPSGSAAVSAQRVPAGTYALSETGTGAAATGYVQDGTWVCRTAGGATVPVTGGNVTLVDAAASTVAAAITCTVANRLATGSLQISKVVDAPAGAYIGGTTQTFAGSYDCGTGSTGTFSTLTIAAPVTIAGIPAGRTCIVTETPPTGGLANASYAWGTPTYSTQPVTIDDQATAQVTITNPVVQRFGSFSITKVVANDNPDSPGGYIGGTTRVFPVSYTCTLAGGPTSAGTLDVTLAQAATPATPIPTGSVCTFSETLTAQPGDFADPSYVWTVPSFAPTTVTIGVDETSAVTLTNLYTRQFGSLQIAKVVSGAGYIGGGGANFTVAYDCGPQFIGSVAIAAGGSATVSGLPAGALCFVQEAPPAATLLAPAYTWGDATWAPGPLASVPANGTASLTVTNPTIPIFGQVRVTKQITGATEGVTASAAFRITATCTDGGVYVFDVRVGATVSTPDIPVGTSCTITEDPPTGGLIDGSFAWGPTPPPQVVTVNASGEVVAVTMTNDVVRVLGALTITKASITPGGVVDPARTFAIDYSCAYGDDAPVAATVTLAAGATATTPPLLVGSLCTVAEDPAALTAPPDPDDPSWVWLPVAYEPAEQVVVSSATTPVSVTVVNTIQQLTGSFNVTKSVVGAGKEGGYTPGDLFDFDVTCVPGSPTIAFELADGDSFDGGAQTAFASCTVTETAVPPTTPAYGWDQVEFAVNGQPAGSGDSVTFQIPASGAPVQVNVVNPITPRLSSVTVTKTVTGATGGLAPDAPPFTVTLSCGPGLTYPLAVPANGSVTQDGIPIGSVCTAEESSPGGGLVDESFAWGAPTYTPADGTVTVIAGAAATVGITNPILRVTAPVRLVKTFSGAQGIVDPARTYPVTWTCTYGGATVAGGDVDVVADPAGVTLADDVPVTSVCTAAEGDLGPPSLDPAFRWELPAITGTTVAAPGPNTITVANALTRDSGRVLVRKEVIGATEGYIGTGEDFTLHGQCSVPGQPQIPTRTADGSIADGGEVIVVASIGWTCSGYEDTPSQDLLLDDSYAWGPPILDPAGTFVLTRAAPEQIFLAQNPVVRVASTFSIVKAVADPFGVVDPATSFSGTYSCQYRTDPPVAGTWTITPGTNDTFEVPASLFLGSVCTVTEDDPGGSGLPDGSFAWSPATIGAPVTVVAGGTASVTVTNTVVRLWSGLQITKAVVDPDGGLVPGAQFGGVWSCEQGADTFSDRFSVTAGATTTVFTPAEERVPATSVCTIIEDTLDADGLRDGSFGWGEPTYTPADVVLGAGTTATLGVTNSVIRVYSDVAIRKAVTGPAIGLVPDDRPFTGTISCQYGTDPPIETTWSATIATPALRAGVLVESVCIATEDDPGEGGQPVTGDSSYIWGDPVVSGPVTVTPPDVATPPIVVTNPTRRLFGTFTVAKAVTGAIEGIVDPSQPFPMTYECTPGTGAPITGVIEVPIAQTRSVGPERQIPTGSACTLTEPLAGMPDLVDDAWTWGDPTFVVAGVPVATIGRVLSFVIPTPQEDEPEPNVEIGVTNPVNRTFGTYSIAKSSDPASGTVVQPGSVLTYSLTVTSTGAVPVHDVVVDDDLSGVLPNAAVVAGSINAPSGTTAALDEASQRLVWTVGTVPPDSTLVLTYQVQIDTGAAGVVVTNSVRGGGDVPPDPCSTCVVSHETSSAPIIAKDLVGLPVLDATDGNWIVRYRIAVSNPNAANAAPYSLSDTLGFAPDFEVRSATVTSSPAGVTLAVPAWNGTTNTAIAAGATIAPSATHTYDVTVRVFVPSTVSTAALQCTTPTESAGSGLFNAAQVSSLGSVASDSACGSVPIPDAADLRLVKVVDRAAVTIDRQRGIRARIVYSITVTNAGPRPAVDAVVIDTLPGGVVPVSAVPSAGTCSRDGAILTCPVGTIASGATVRIAVTIELPSTYSSDTVYNVARVSSATPDPDLSNNSSGASTRVTTESAIAISGTQVAGLLVVGAGLLGAGTALLLTARRRRRPAPA